MRGLDGEDRQENVANPGGFVHVVQNGDMHVFGDNVPLYVLRLWRRAPTCDAETLRGLPSQILDGRNQVVRFTGRAAELDELQRWRDGTASLAVRWLFGPGGQGKSRLADEFAAESVAAGWKVMVAEQGPGTLVAPHGVHDLAVGDAAGLLLIVDYADRWPFTHLIWLFSNGLLHTDKPTRVLLLARGTDIWPALQAALRREYNTIRIGLSARSLRPLPDDGQARDAMFRAAVDGFSDVYGLTDRADVDPPQALTGPDMALTLALHMAALVGVDAKATGGRLPTDMQELTSYLIEREYLHWTILYGDGTHELDPSERTYRTPPHVMHHAVFAAALTGSMDRAAGSGLVGRLGLPGGAGRTLTDHATCYPHLPPDPATVLEPLQPDRFAEDLLALSTPGHHVAYPAQDWATGTVRALLDTPHDPPQYLSRALLYLTAATQRWPHVGDAALYPLLRARPELMVAAGNAALLSFNAIEDVDDELLYAVEREFPPRPDPNVDIGVAAIAERLTDRRLASTADARERAGLQGVLGWRLANAGRLDAALPRCQDAVAILSQLAADDPAAHAMALTMAMNDLGSCLAEMGRVVEAGQVYEQVVTIFRAEPALPVRLMLAGTLRSLAQCRDTEGRRQEAIDMLEEAVRIHRVLLDSLADQPAESGHEVYRAEMASALGDLGGTYAQSRTPWRAVPLLEEAARRFRLLAEQQPSDYRPELTRAVISLAMIRSDSGRPHEGLPIAREAEQMARELSDTHPAVHLPDLAMALNNLSLINAKAGNDAESQASAEEAVAIRRRLAQNNPDLYLNDLATSLLNLGAALADTRQWSSAVDHTREALDIRRQLCEADPLAYLYDFRLTARNLTGMLLFSRRWREAMRTRQESRRFVRKIRGAFRAARRRQPSRLNPRPQGALLVGAEDPADELYRGRVMLVLWWDEMGALVVVLNHPTPVSLADVAAPDISQWETLAAAPPVVFEGGPDEVAPAICLAQLRPGADPVPGVQRLAGRLYTIDLGSDVEAVTRMVDRLRIFAGCVVFGPGELDLIIDRGDLTVHGTATTEPFHAEPERLHRELRDSAARPVM
uniref:Tetratricopeptide repeat protein n=1 Tax=Streptomyces sp. NBC_00093 TaxID=2975649 RepID=A0AAU2AEW0_9ACTN